MTQESPSILLVSGVPANADTLKALLEHERPVHLMVPAPELFDLVREMEPSLVILDLESPDLDAPKLCKHLKEHPATSSIPVLVACPDQERAEATILAGAQDCLAKPFHPLLVRTRARNAIELGRCKHALHTFALVDELTGIPNRRRFEEFLNMEWRRNLRNQTPLTIILLDLDLFTAFSDHYGTSHGDACLRKVASVLVAAGQRPGDLIARHGRGGFACVLPETDSVGAVSMAERFRAEVFALAIPNEAAAQETVLTASLGVATGVPMTGAEPEDLLTLAERHLFDAKRSGRNRVVFGS
jgi:diguanylate cyclase (GGDEF)-like protein